VGLTTNRVIIHRRPTSIPISQGANNMVHMLTKLDEMPPVCKITSRHNAILYFSTWISGVTTSKQKLKQQQQ